MPSRKKYWGYRLILSFEDYLWPMKNPDHKPFAHQLESVIYMLRNRRCYNFSDLGTGKTLSALWAADILMINEKIDKVLIISPLSTLGAVWGHEIFSNLPHRRYGIMHGSKSKRISVLNSDCDFYILNHDGVITMRDLIIAAKFDLIIVDELTAFKTYTTQRSKAMRRISASVPAVWGMTGDPTPNTPFEAFGQAHVVNPGNPYLPKYQTKFRDMVEYRLNQFTWLPKDDAKATVNKVLQPAIRFERSKCLDIPPCQYIDQIVEFTPQQKHYYKEMKDELMIEYADGEITASNAAVKAIKLLQIAAGSVKDTDGNSHKLDSSSRDDAIWAIFEETGHTKLVIFSAFRASIQALLELFNKRHVKVSCIHGGVPQASRASRIRDFQEGDLQVLVIQPQSSAHGITLTAANVIVWQSLVPSGEIYKQANGRITRAGQTKKQLIIHLLGCQAEKRILSILKGKGQMSKEILRMFVDL